MKLFFCPACEDVQKLWVGADRTCACGASGGRYLDGVAAEVWGQAIPLGFANATLAAALRLRPDEGMGSRFVAFVIPRVCPTVRAR